MIWNDIGSFYSGLENIIFSQNLILSFYQKVLVTTWTLKAKFSS